MKRIKILLLMVLSLMVISCEELADLLKESDSGLTESEVIEGLKTALQVGTDTAVTLTSKVDGYFRDEAIKILLPPEASVIYDHKDDFLFRSLGLDNLIDNAILSINRAAEDAASAASPILKNAIMSLSISDGWDILNGKNPAETDSPAGSQEEFDSTAATNYLISTTYDGLYNAFKPKITTSLEKPLVASISTMQIWDNLTSAYNTVAGPLGYNTVETELDAFVTGKALDGLFLKVSEEEVEIRRDPLQWAGTAVGNILKKVFGKD